MMDRLRQVVTVLLIPWTFLLFLRYVTGLAEMPPQTVLQRYGGLILAGALAVGLPAVGFWLLENRWGTQASARILLFAVGVLAVSIAAAAQVLLSFVAALLLLTAACGYGALIARWVDRGGGELSGGESGSGETHAVNGVSPWHDVPFLATLGWALFIAVGLAAGTARMLTSQAVGGVCLVGIALVVFQGRRPSKAASIPARPEEPEPYRDQQRLRTRPPVFYWWGLAVLILIGLVGAVAPEVRYDALAAHLPVAREFALQGGIVEMRQNTASYFQLNGELLYAMAMLLVPGETLPKLMHYFAGVLASLLVYSLGARIWGPRVGLAAAAILASTPLMWWVGSAAYTDLWLVLFVAGTILAMLKFARRPSPRRALVIGLLAGAAVGTKITGFLMILPLTVTLLLWIRRSHDPQARRSVLWRHPGARWSMVSALALGIGLTGAYFYARSWILTGSPTFPLRNPFFTSPYARPEIIGEFLGRVGMGKSLGDLLLIPWRMTLYPARFVEDSNIGIVYLAVLPAALLSILRAQVPGWMVGVLVTAGGIWFLAAQYLRFLLPALPIAALIAAAGLFVGPAPRRASVISGFVLALCIAAAAGAWTVSGPWNFPLPILRGAMTRDEYVARHVGGFPVAQFASRSLPESARIYSAGDDMAFHYRRFFVPLSWHGRIFSEALGASILNARTGREVQAILSKAGFTHLVVHREHPGIAHLRRPDGWIARAAFWEEGPRLEHAHGEYYLFRLQLAQ